MRRLLMVRRLTTRLDAFRNSWPTTEQGSNGEMLYFSGLPPPHFDSPRPAATSTSPPGRLSPRVRSPQHGGPASTADPITLLSSPFGLSSGLRASISAAEQIHADVIRPFMQDGQSDMHRAPQSTRTEALTSPSITFVGAQQAPLPDLSHVSAVPLGLDSESSNAAGKTQVHITVGSAKNLCLFNTQLQKQKLQIIFEVANQGQGQKTLCLGEAVDFGHEISAEPEQLNFGQIFRFDLAAHQHKVTYAEAEAIDLRRWAAD